MGSTPGGRCCCCCCCCYCCYLHAISVAVLPTHDLIRTPTGYCNCPDSSPHKRNKFYIFCRHPSQTTVWNRKITIISNERGNHSEISAQRVRITQLETTWEKKTIDSRKFPKQKKKRIRKDCLKVRPKYQTERNGKTQGNKTKRTWPSRGCPLNQNWKINRQTQGNKTKRNKPSLVDVLSLSCAA